MNSQPHPRTDDLDAEALSKVLYHANNQLTNPRHRTKIGVQAAIDGSLTLDLPPQTLRRAILTTHIALDVYGLDGSPEGVAAGCVYFTARVCNSARTQDAVGEAFNCTNGTVSNHYRSLMPHIDYYIPKITTVDYYKTVADNEELPATHQQLGIDKIETPWAFANERLKRKYADGVTTEE